MSGSSNSGGGFLPTFLNRSGGGPPPQAPQQPVIRPPSSSLPDLRQQEQDLEQRLQSLQQQYQACNEQLQKVRRKIQQATSQQGAAASAVPAAAASPEGQEVDEETLLAIQALEEEERRNAAASVARAPPPAAAAARADVKAEASLQQLALDRRIHELLRGTFQLASFREHQEAIVKATLAGQDVFVIMRTGGGKSLTYQLPALLEGRPPPGHSDGKVTLVVSPLLSLIQDQEEQMNQFCFGSAVSFSSGNGNSQAQQNAKWKRIQDPSEGICLVLVTPERIVKSNKLRQELQQLYNQGRLGRVVIDECHCASTWGHDFRPDYTKLGQLKRQFPNVPVLAVTATASDRVRTDCCRILELNTNYRFFRSTANRLNLHYSVRSKADSSSSTKDGVIVDMAAFIKERHPNQAGIIYTLSKNDANNVADKLCDCGIIAQAYHADVSATKKQQVHQSWMRNETQVVVATIAFGLGINKPDVRFVLHHTLSKTLDSYYQESGRAGRDGKDADCVLFYTPKDVTRMIKLVHSNGGVHQLTGMVRYAQATGNDVVCRAILMTHLAEPNAPNVADVLLQNEGITTEPPRDVGRHAQTATRLLALKDQAGENVTLCQLVKAWRSKPENAPQCVQDFPPGKELNIDECERIVVSLWVEGVIETNVQWTGHDDVVYFRVTQKGYKFAGSDQPKFVVRFPKKETKEEKAAKQTKARQTTAGLDGWIQAKPKAAKRKKTSAPSKAKGAKKTKAASKPAGKKAKAKKTSKSKKPRAASTRNKQQEIIELSSDDEDDDDIVDAIPLPQSVKSFSNPEDALWEDKSSSENEFVG